jgi:hypothetical protein
MPLAASLYKIIAFFLTIAIVCAPGLCNCIDTTTPVPAKSHACCNQSADDSKSSSNGQHDHSQDCNHCNPTLKSAMAEQGHQPNHAFDAAFELPSPVPTVVNPVDSAAVSAFSSDTIPPLLRDLFHIRASLLN